MSTMRFLFVRQPCRPMCIVLVNKLQDIGNDK